MLARQRIPCRLCLSTQTSTDPQEKPSWGLRIWVVACGVRSHSFRCWEVLGENQVYPQLAQSSYPDHHLFLRDLSHNLLQTLDIGLLVNLSALVEL